MWRGRCQHGIRPTLTFWIRTIADVVAHSMAERFSSRVTPRLFPDVRRPILGAVASALLFDIRYSVRRLFKTPGFTVIATLTLALGVGTNAVMFTIVNSVYFKPLPYEESERLVFIGQGDAERDYPACFPAYEYFRDNSQSLEDLATWSYWSTTLRWGEDPEQLTGAVVSANMFDILGVHPVLGRDFSPEEDDPDGEKVVVLSYATWQRVFGGAPDAIGSTLRLGTGTFTVIGVMPAHFVFPSPRVQFWFSMSPMVREASFRSLRLVGRLADDVTYEQATADIQMVGDRLYQDSPDAKSGERSFLKTLHAQTLGKENLNTLIAFSVAVGFLLLIACANLTNLLLARSTVRQREIALRRALGATSRRVATTIVSESLVLAIAGGVLGIAAATWGTRILLQYAPTLPRANEIGIDAMTVLFTLGLSAAAGLLIGLVPVFQQRNVDLNQHVRTGGRGTGGLPLRNAFSVLQVALTFALLVGAGLMARSLWNLQSVDPGFVPEQALIVRVNPPASQYPSPESRVDYYEGLLERMRTLPRVSAVGATSFLPFEGWNSSEFVFEGQENLSVEELPEFEYDVVTTGYFAAMGIPIRSGRAFSTTDDDEAQPVVVINEALAHRAWPNESAIGKRIGMYGSGGNRWYHVVGVAGDVKHQGLESATNPKVYHPVRQLPWEYSMQIVVRAAAGEPMDYAPAIRTFVKEFDSEPPLVQTYSLELWLDRLFSEARFNTTLLAIFTIGALALSTLGLYAVISFGVAQRTHELGVRIALGADGNTVHRLIILGGLKLALLGIAIGVGAAIALSRVLTTLLFGVSALDPFVYICVAVLLLSVAAVASGLPSIRASRVDPLVTLRAE